MGNKMKALLIIDIQNDYFKGGAYELVNPQIGERVFDPSCGTAGFLVSAYTHMLKPYTEKDGKLGANLTDNKLWDKLSNDTFFGNDSDISMIRISMMNMMLHDIENPHIKQADTLSKSYTEKDKYQVVLANPPFKGSIDNYVKFIK